MRLDTIEEHGETLSGSFSEIPEDGSRVVPTKGRGESMKMILIKQPHQTKQTNLEILFW